ncbi:MAG: alpha/beta hydrolase [Adhaeribacter sp.]
MKKLLLLSLTLLLTSTALVPKPAPADLLAYRDEHGRQRQVQSARDWQHKRRQILQGLEQAMGPLPAPSQLPLGLQVLDSLQTPSYTRLNIRFTVAENEKLPALLYVPRQTGKKKKRAAMLVLHGTGAAGKQLVDGASPLANRAIAKELAERGYVVIAPDYPSFGDLKDYDFSTDRYESGTMKAIVNHMRCVDLLQARADVDPKRIGVAGHSLGGHNAMFAAAFDTRLKAVVASCGWTMMDYYDIGPAAVKIYGGRLGPWAQERYMPLLRSKYQLDPARMPFDFHEVIAALAPRPFFSNSPLQDSNFDAAGVRQGIAAASQVYNLLKAPDQLQVRYPEAAHDFPQQVRLEAYRFLDKTLRHRPAKDDL